MVCQSNQAGPALFRLEQALLAHCVARIAYFQLYDYRRACYDPRPQQSADSARL
jgi:hypothetical protein